MSNTAFNTDTLAEWNLSAVPQVFQDSVRAAIENRDGASFIGYVDRGSQLNFLCANLLNLQMNGMYEAALIDGYVGMKHGTRHYPMLHLLRLFRLADRVKLMQLSDRAQTFPITVYRGVAGRGRSRRIRGLSWTSNLNIACWFARRAGIKLDDPAVYEATMTLENVFCSCKYECEIIGYPSKCRRMSMTLEELTTKAEMWDRENEESRLRLIEEYKTQQPVTEVFNAVD